jgi:hypothetical protein
MDTRVFSFSEFDHLAYEIAHCFHLTSRLTVCGASFALPIYSTVALSSEVGHSSVAYLWVVADLLNKELWTGDKG